MSEKIIYSMMKVSKVLPNGKTIIKDISLSYFYGAKIGVIGLNGSGKSSLLRIMAGEDTSFNGEAHLSDNYTVGHLEQEPKLTPGKTVRETIEEAVPETILLLKEFDEINQKFADESQDMEKLLEQQASVQEKLERLDAWSLDDKLNFAMEALRCPPPEQKVDLISGGERRRVALCRLLLQEPDILLLDEPTNHLDAESVQWLEQHLKNYKGTIIAVTHDRYFLDNVAGWILELDRGHGIPWQGNYSSWLEQKERRLAHETRKDEKRRKILQHELEWIHMTPSARNKKNKARVHAYEKIASEASEARTKELQIYIPPGPRLGNKVIEVHNVSMSYDNKLLYENLNFTLPRGAILGVIGANGTGKTTLFRLLTGELKAKSGSIDIGDTVKLAHMEQSKSALDGNKTVWEMVSGERETISLGKQEVNSRAYLSRFNISGDEQQKLLKNLSGGERNRVQMALLLQSSANVLLLDEPTNDLDVNTLRALEEAFLNYLGCAIIISHDRWFLDRIATHILAFEGSSKATFMEGNYSDYEMDRIKRLGEQAKTPKRIRYAKIKR